jgi:hypothetical protein
MLGINQEMRRPLETAAFFFYTDVFILSEEMKRELTEEDGRI